MFSVYFTTFCYGFFSLSFSDTITAYCKHPCCCGSAACGVTYSGRDVAWGMVAADLKVYPLGTILLIDGFKKPFVVEDIGGKIKGRHLDIFFPDELGGHVAALNFGRQDRKVTVLRWGGRSLYAKK